LCVWRYTVRTNIVLDDELVAEAMRLTGIKTKREVVREALKHLVRAKRRKPLSELWGKIRFAPGYDYKAARRGSQ
jgi:Arc/MetJ family transcription regulator